MAERRRALVGRHEGSRHAGRSLRAAPDSGPSTPGAVIAAFSVVAATLLLQGSTLPALVRLLRVPGPDRAQDALQQALVLQRRSTPGRRKLDEEADGDTPKDVVEDLAPGASVSPTRSGSGWVPATAGPRPPPGRSAGCGWPCSGRERNEVVAVYRSGKVPAEVLEGVMERLDQEEAMLVAFGEGAATGQTDLLTPQGLEECEHLRTEPLVAVPGQPRRLRGLPRDRRARLGVAAHVPALRARRLLRLLAAPARERPLRRHLAPGDAEHRARRGLALVLRRQGRRLTLLPAHLCDDHAR